MIQALGLMLVACVAGYGVHNRSGLLVGLCIGFAWMLGVSYG